MRLLAAQPIPPAGETVRGILACLYRCLYLLFSGARAAAWKRVFDAFSFCPLVFFLSCLLSCANPPTHPPTHPPTRSPAHPPTHEKSNRVAASRGCDDSGTRCSWRKGASSSSSAMTSSAQSVEQGRTSSRRARWAKTNPFFFAPVGRSRWVAGA